MRGACWGGMSKVRGLSVDHEAYRQVLVALERKAWRAGWWMGRESVVAVDLVRALVHAGQIKSNQIK